MIKVFILSPNVYDHNASVPTEEEMDRVRERIREYFRIKDINELIMLYLDPELESELEINPVPEFTRNRALWLTSERYKGLSKADSVYLMEGDLFISPDVAEVFMASGLINTFLTKDDAVIDEALGLIKAIKNREEK